MSPLVIIGAVVAVLAVIGVSLLVVNGGKDDQPVAGLPETGAVSTPIGSASGDVATDPGTSVTSSVTETAPTQAPPTVTEDPEQAALAELESLRQQGLQQVTPQGQWVAQLASKIPGIVDPVQTTASGSHTFMAADILAEHQALANADNRGATVILLQSTDYGKRQLYQGQAMWVTLAVGSFFSADEVRSWCLQRFPDLSGESLKNACAPRQLKAVYA